jgi:hypothetical protein
VLREEGIWRREGGVRVREGKGRGRRPIDLDPKILICVTEIRAIDL